MIERVEKAGTHTKDEHLRVSGFLWWLTRSDTCSCRKLLTWSGMTMPPEEQDTRLHERPGLCETCEKTFRTNEDPFLSTGESQSPRSECLKRCLRFRLKANRAWIYYTENFRPSAARTVCLPKPTDEGLDEMRSPGLSLSWMERYRVASTSYLSMRSQGELEHERKPDHLKGMKTWKRFKELCGEMSEECRRSAYYASFGIAGPDAWLEVERLLYPLVIESIKHPVQSWSHE